MFAKLPPAVIALEAGTRSAWIAAALEGLGHRVLVANPRKVKAIGQSQQKNDPNDARLLGQRGAPSELRAWGLKLAERGGKAAKKRTVVAAAHRLAAQMHRLWLSEQDYDPFYATRQKAAAGDGGAPGARGFMETQEHYRLPRTSRSDLCMLAYYLVGGCTPIRTSILCFLMKRFTLSPHLKLSFPKTIIYSFIRKLLLAP